MGLLPLIVTLLALLFLVFCLWRALSVPPRPRPPKAKHPYRRGRNVRVQVERRGIDVVLS